MSSTSEQRGAEVVRAVVRTVAALTFSVLTVAFLVNPEWIEAASGVEPDGGSGVLELALALGAGLLAVATTLGAGFAWRRVLTSRA